MAIFRSTVPKKTLAKNCLSMKGKGAAMGSGDADIELDIVDIDRECPYFKNALARPDGQFLIDEIDQIRVDLEILLAASVARIASLQEDLEACEAGGVFTSKSSSKPAKVVSNKSKVLKASDLADSPMKKRSKSFQSRQQPLSINVGSSHKSRTGKSGESAGNGNVPPSAVTPSTETARLLHSKAVDRFWSSVEPYCAEISPSLLKGIEDYLTNYGKDGTSKPGVNGSRSPVPPGISHSLRSSTSSSTTNLPRGKGQNGTNLGPLTRRLVAALLEDNYAADSPMSSSADQFSTTSVDGIFGPPPSSMALARALDLGNTVALERRVRRILEKHDIFDSSDSSDSSTDDQRTSSRNGQRSPSSPAKRGTGSKTDEVSAEIARCQEELRATTESNRAMLVSLASIAKSVAQVNSYRSQLSRLESEIEESYQRVMSAKQRKKTPVVISREREQFQRLLDEWKRVAVQLEQLT